MEEGDFKDEWDLVDGRQKPAASLTIIHQAPHKLYVKVIAIKR